jgi:membrane fusion protein (multidrug efflux system)
MLRLIHPSFALPYVLFCVLYMPLIMPLNCYGQPPIKVVEVQSVDKGSVAETIQVLGTLKSEKQTYLTIQTTGTLRLHKAAGSWCKKGSLIASIDNGEGAKAYQALKETETLSQKHLTRLQRLERSGTLSQKNLEDQKATFLTQQKQRLDTKRQLDSYHIRAPFDGMLGVFTKLEGSTVKQGDQIALFYDPAALMLDFALPLKAARLIKDRAPVCWRNGTYALTYIQRALDPQTHMCPAYVTLPNQQDIIGTTEDICLTVRQKNNVIRLPNTAIFTKDEKPYTYTIKDQKATLTLLTIGLKGCLFTEIISGLKGCDQFITTGHDRLYDGAPVRTQTKVS